MPEERGAREEEREEKKEETKKGLGFLSKILIAIIGILVGGILSAAVAYIVATKVKPPDITFEEEIPKKKKKPTPLHTEEIGEFVAKLQDPYEDHFIKIEDLTLAYNNIKYPELIKELTARKYQITDIIDSILTSKTSEIYSEEGRNLLKKEIITKLNEVLINGKIEDVYFKWVYQ